MFSFELQRRLCAAGSPILSVAAHGVLPLLVAASSPDVVPGGAFELKGYPKSVKIPPAAMEPGVALSLMPNFLSE